MSRTFKDGMNSKKAAGNAKKAENAAKKAAEQQSKQDGAEAANWSKGAKSNKKADAAAEKKQEAERKKAEKAMLQEAEDMALSSSGPKNSKKAVKKSAKPAPAPSRKLDLAQLDDEDGGAEPSGKAGKTALNATGIDNALDALNLTSGAGASDKVERHPERRFKAALAAYEEKRMPELEKENPGLRRNQRMELLRKEFEKSEENPFNQVSITYNATRDDVATVKAGEKKKVEDRLAS